MSWAMTRIRWTLDDALVWSPPMERWLADLILTGPHGGPSSVGEDGLPSESGAAPRRAFLEVDW